jgi:hypothetical protein
MRTKLLILVAALVVIAPADALYYVAASVAGIVPCLSP